MERKLIIEGSDISSAKPDKSGRILVNGLIRDQRQIISIAWEVDGCTGSTNCEAWRGQYEIDCLSRAGYRVLEISI